VPGGDLAGVPAVDLRHDDGVDLHHHAAGDQLGNAFALAFPQQFGGGAAAQHILPVAHPGVEPFANIGIDRVDRHRDMADPGIGQGIGVLRQSQAVGRHA